MTADYLINTFGLIAHPEGGWYKESYRSNETIDAKSLPERFTESRHLSTAIYFLLEQGDFSAFHRIKSDECWHFYAGESLTIYIIQTDGELTSVVLGNQPNQGEVFQYVVPANCWFASRPSDNSRFSLVGCTVSPGFDFKDFEMGQEAELIRLYPQHKDTIRLLCK